MSEHYTPSHEYHDAVRPLPELLQKEIIELQQVGFEVTIGQTEDRAYDDPEATQRMFTTLSELGHTYQERARQEARPLALGGAALYAAGRSVPPLGAVLPKGLRTVYRRNEARLEMLRQEVLFSADKLPWHKQAGKALALGTITDAHELRVTIQADGQPLDHPEDQPGIYDTMSGRLDLDVDSFVFDERDGWLSGLSVEQSLTAASERFYGKTPDQSAARTAATMRDLREFLTQPISQEFKDIVAHCQDSLGIRSRKQEVRRAIALHVDTVLADTPDKETMVLLSVGCGTAQSILEVAHDIQQRGVEPQIILLDQDPLALAAARTLAEQHDLGGAIELRCERLFDKQGRPSFDLPEILQGRTIDIAEDTGLREYLPDTIYRNLTEATWQNLTAGGMMTTGNMNKHRPQPEFLHGLMGWQPQVKMRRIVDGFRLHQGAGLSPLATKARVTQDGVYTLFFSYKD